MNTLTRVCRENRKFSMQSFSCVCCFERSWHLEIRRPSKTAHLSSRSNLVDWIARWKMWFAMVTSTLELNTDCCSTRLSIGLPICIKVKSHCSFRRWFARVASDSVIVLLLTRASYGMLHFIRSSFYVLEFGNFFSVHDFHNSACLSEVAPFMRSTGQSKQHSHHHLQPTL